MQNSEQSPFEALANLIKKMKLEGKPTQNVPHVPYLKLPKGKLKVADQWASLLWNIETAENHGTRALQGMTLALARIIQADILENLLLDARQHYAALSSSEELLWGFNQPVRGDGASIRSLLIKKNNSQSIELAYTAVIPQPWERWRLARALQNLGQGAMWGEWKQSDNIHAIEWAPWPLVWVNNGHHSTMAGILTHGGKLKANETFDAKDLLLSVYTDGMNWLRVDNDQVIASVSSLPMAAIFEIGRRLIRAPKK
ncbi:MAG: DUF6710 family protein [Methylotenera sp.]